MDPCRQVGVSRGSVGPDGFFGDAPAKPTTDVPGGPYEFSDPACCVGSRRSQVAWRRHARAARGPGDRIRMKGWAESRLGLHPDHTLPPDYQRLPGGSATRAKFRERNMRRSPKKIHAALVVAGFLLASAMAEAALVAHAVGAGAPHPGLKPALRLRGRFPQIPADGRR